MNIDLHKLTAALLYNPQDPILFNSGFFLYFFAALLLCYQFVHRSPRGRVWLFTLFSLYFFYKACGYYVGLVILAAIVDFNLSRWIYYSESRAKRNALLTFSIVVNLGLLFYFKYTDFFIGILNDLELGHFRPLKLLLPIGISFYTFENLSYTIDVYRRHFKPVDRFMDYLFFLSFFPKLMMGPIVRAADFIPQIDKPYHVTSEDISKGLYLIIAGLFKKVVISDYIYVNFVQYVFDDPSKHVGLECLMAVYGYAMVIYCDFSGYSDMAIGIARWIGFKIPPNFDSPYQSSSITEFWRRWHISLSSWLKDYLYIPLGGNRKGKTRQYINLMLTMLIGGFWHGANWNFIFWGGMHGLALAADKKRMEWEKRRQRPVSPAWRTVKKIGGILFTFHLVCFCWIFFKASSFSDAWTMLHQIFLNFDGGTWSAFYAGYSTVLWVMLLGYVLHFIPARTEERAVRGLQWLPSWSYVFILTGLIWAIIQVKTAQPVMPIYLQF
ncbi:MBOAT family O-acyltransferase [Compostibacter hankyongensis]|uniref:MBOAT family protein n=1 Tax=Compostibacter hankyongensis TaxID=1007089 RepID=A0ABP8FI69_9BACT